MPARPRDGFTLIELMIVVAIIAVISAVAIPNLLNAKKSAAEARIIGALHTLVSANEQFRTRFGTYAPTTDALVQTGYFPDRSANQDPRVVAVIYVGVQQGWAIQVNPLDVLTGIRSFYCDVTGVIRFSSTGPATSASQPLE